MRTALGIALVALLGGACAPGPDSQPRPTTYRLEASRTETATPSPSFPETILQVTPATGSFAASRQNIFYSLAYRSPAHVGRYGKSRWVAPPNRMISRTVASWLAHSGHWQAVVGPDRSAPADYVLDLEIRRIVQVFSAPQEGEAHLTVEANLKGPEDRLQAQRLFSYRRSTPGSGAEAATDAQRRNLARLCRELETWLLRAMGESPQGS